MMTRRTSLLALAAFLAPAPLVRAQDGSGRPAACTPEATARAAEQRGLRCRHCSSYEVVSTGRDRYTCCHCGRAASFGGFVRRR